MKIAVLAGGLSPERDVSLSSGTLIANALMENGHDVLLLDLYLGTRGTSFEPVYQNKASGKQFFYQVPEQEPDLERLRKESGNGDGLIGEGVLNLCKKADLAFLALHGSIGENGQLQAVFDVHGIRYTGTGYAGSLLAMDKDLSKRLMRAGGIATADWMLIDLREKYDVSEVGFPCVVKPCSCGSSVGVALAENPEQLAAALEAAKQYEDFVLIEDKIEGREFSVGILGGSALPAIEIRPKSGFYDYKNKYQAGLTEEICPANLLPEAEETLEACALAVHKALRLGYYSRVDFILDNTGRAFCLEANTLPGMTPTSLLPQEALAAGIVYQELCEKIARSAL